MDDYFSSRGIKVSKRGVISSSSLFKAIGQHPRKKTITTVPTPLPQTTKLCELGKQGGITIKQIMDYRDYMMVYDVRLWYIIELQLIGALRVSEVLAIKPGDISKSGHVRIKSAKGSNDAVIYVNDSRDYLIYCRQNSIEPFNGLDRFYVYREFKKKGISISNVKGEKQAVTHAIRHLVLNELKKSNFTESERTKLSRHKNSENLKHYER